MLFNVVKLFTLIPSFSEFREGLQSFKHEIMHNIQQDAGIFAFKWRKNQDDDEEEEHERKKRNIDIDALFDIFENGLENAGRDGLAEILEIVKEYTEEDSDNKGITEELLAKIMEIKFDDIQIKRIKKAEHKL